MRIKHLRLSAASVLLSVVGGVAEADTLQIVDLEDIDFGEVLPTDTQVEERIRFCVVSEPAGPYQITAYGSGPGGAFVLTAPGLPNTIGFDVYISKQRGRSGNPLTPGVPLTGLSGEERLPNGRCRPPRMNLLIDIDEADLSRVPGGSYSALLQLTVAPE